MFNETQHTQSALGAALQAAYKMAAPTGTIFLPLYSIIARFDAREPVKNCSFLSLLSFPVRKHSITFSMFSGGRITVFQSTLPNVGPGSVPAREVLGDKKGEPALMTPSNDFYKKLALDCSGQQVNIYFKTGKK